MTKEIKAIMISIKPKWVVKILNGEKTIEIRKTLPKCDLPIDVYIYCTKSKYFGYISKRYIGKVVAKFTLRKVDTIKEEGKGIEWCYVGTDFDKTCLDFCELDTYLNAKKNGVCGYGWHISNLEIFDKPKELSEFYKVGAKEEYEHIMSIDKRQAKPYIDEFYRLIKAPQSWCYIEVRK